MGLAASSKTKDRPPARGGRAKGRAGPLPPPHAELESNRPPWTTALSTAPMGPWTAGLAAGPAVDHRSGKAAPWTVPPVHRPRRGRGQPLRGHRGTAHRTALQLATTGLKPDQKPNQPPHPSRRSPGVPGGPYRLAKGRSPRGLGAACPAAVERPRRGRDAGGSGLARPLALPPQGGLLIQDAPRTTHNQHATHTPPTHHEHTFTT